MASRVLRFVCVVTLLASPSAAQNARFVADVDTVRTPWTHLKFNDDPENFQFAIVTDRTGNHRPGVFLQGVDRVNLLQPEFVMSVGDLIEGYTEDLDEIERQWREFDGFVDALDMPFFYVAGNHDVSNGVMEKAWQRRFGRLYYHFVYRDVLFLALNSEARTSGHIGREQVAYVDQVLRENPDVRWTMVFLHKPLWEYEPEQNGWADVERLLAGRPHNVYAGHRHRYLSNRTRGAEYVVLGTMGARNRGRGADFGEFDHFMWVTMTDDGPIMANLLLDGVWDSRVATQHRRMLRRPVVAGAAVRTAGIMVDDPVFERASTTLRLTNDADVPMHVDLRIRQDPLVTTSTTDLRTTVAPNSVELVELDVVAATPMAVEDVEPRVANWSVRYDLEGELNPLEIRGTHRIVIDAEHTLRPSTGMRVDGLLGDWSLGSTPVVPGQVQADSDGWRGSDDASFRFGVTYDEAHVYIGVEVVDDRVVLNPGRDFRRQDSLLVQFDGRPSAVRRMGETPESDNPFLLAVIPAATGGRLVGVDTYPNGIMAATTLTLRGYNAEIAIPIGYIEELQGGELDSLRLNIGVNDADGRRTRNRIWWRPAWDSAEDYAESGVFRRR